MIAKTPHGHWHTTTLIAALGLGGVVCSTLVEGPVNGDVFEAFVEQVLVPELLPGDIVVMDNLSSHKRRRSQELIESVGAELRFHPPVFAGPEPHRYVVLEDQAEAARPGMPHEGHALASDPTCP